MSRRFWEKCRRHKRTGFNTHHRKPRSIGGTNHPSNLSIVDIQEHSLWHQMFGNLTPQEIAWRINKTWVDSNYYFSVHKKGESDE